MQQRLVVQPRGRRRALGSQLRAAARAVVALDRGGGRRGSSDLANGSAIVDAEQGANVIGALVDTGGVTLEELAAGLGGAKGDEHDAGRLAARVLEQLGVLQEELLREALVMIDGVDHLFGIVGGGDGRLTAATVARPERVLVDHGPLLHVGSVAVHEALVVLEQQLALLEALDRAPELVVVHHDVHLEDLVGEERVEELVDGAWVVDVLGKVRDLDGEHASSIRANHLPP